MQPLFLEKGIKNKLKGRDETHRVENVGGQEGGGDSDLLGLGLMVLGTRKGTG